MKKGLYVLLSALVIILSFCACGNNDNGNIGRNGTLTDDAKDIINDGDLDMNDNTKNNANTNDNMNGNNNGTSGTTNDTTGTMTDDATK